MPSRTLGSLYLSRKWDLTVALSALRWANWASLSILRTTQGSYPQLLPLVPGCEHLYPPHPKPRYPPSPQRSPNSPQFLSS